MPAPSDLQWFPLALTGGLHASKAIPDPTDFEELQNFSIFRGRFAVRAPLTVACSLLDDTGSPTGGSPITHVLAIAYHVDQCYVVGYSAGQTDVYLYRLEADGTAELTDDEYPYASPIATVWSTITTVPRVTLESFEGGSATAGKQRLYIADYTGTYPTKYWNSDDTSLATVQEDFNDDNTKEDLYFPLVFAYAGHLFGTEFLESGTVYPGLLRISQPGLIPADEPGVTYNASREWWYSDFRQVGSRGEAITCIGEAGGDKLLFKRRKVYALYGGDINSFSLRVVDNRVGAVGPHAAASLPNGQCLFWSDKGPHLTDGQQVIDIGEPIRDRVVSISYSMDVSVEYSPDDGLVYFIVPDDGASPYLRFAWDVVRQRWVDVGSWLVLSGTTETTTLTVVPDADSGDVDTSYTDIEYLNQAGSTPATWYDLVNDDSDATYWKIGTNGTALLSEDFTGSEDTDIHLWNGWWTMGTSNLLIKSNAAYTNNMGTTEIIAIKDATDYDDLEVHADVTRPAGGTYGSNYKGGVIARITSTTYPDYRQKIAAYMGYPVEGYATLYAIETDSSGAIVASDTGVAQAIPIANGETMRVVLRASGTTISAEVQPAGGGAPISTCGFTATTAHTGTYAGVMWQTQSGLKGHIFDNFAVLQGTKNVAAWAVRLDAPVGTPSEDIGAEHKVYVRAARVGTLTGTITCKLYEGDPTDGGSLIASADGTALLAALDTSPTDILAITLTDAEIADITDWSDLWVEMTSSEYTTAEHSIYEVWATWESSVVALRVNDLRAIPDDSLPGPAAAPSTPTFDDIADTSVTVEWTNGDTAIDVTTEVHRSTTTSFTPSDLTLVATVTSGVASYGDTGLTAKTTYYYKLIHVRNGASSSASAQGSVKTAVARPTGLLAGPLATGVKLYFTHNADGADYIIERKAQGTGYSEITTVSAAAAGAKTYEDTGASVTCGLSYTYRVYAQETGEVDSPYTDEASRIACTQPASISTATHEASIEPDCPSEDNVWIEWTGSFNPGDLVLIERNSNGAGYVERFYIPASLGMKTDMWGRRTGAVSQTLQYRLTPYDSGVLPGTPVETTQSNELVSSKPCDERYT